MLQFARKQCGLAEGAPNGKSGPRSACVVPALASTADLQADGALSSAGGWSFATLVQLIAVPFLRAEPKPQVAPLSRHPGRVMMVQGERNAEPTTTATISIVDHPPVYGELLDLLAGTADPEQLLGFRQSHDKQARLDELLDRNRQGALSENDSAELDAYEHFEHVVRLLKARLSQKPRSSPRDPPPRCAAASLSGPPIAASIA